MAFPFKWSFFILQHFIFSLPHEYNISSSNGENFIVLISIGVACFINTVILSKFSIFHTIIDVRFCSFPTVHKYFEFLFSVITFNLSKGVDNIFIHWQSLVFHIRIIELTPSWLLKMISPLQAIMKLEIGFE